jgi:hypothetical protein
LYFRSVNPSSTTKYFCLQKFLFDGKVNNGEIYDFANFRFVEILVFSYILLILEILTNFNKQQLEEIFHEQLLWTKSLSRRPQQANPFIMHLHFWQIEKVCLSKLS